MSALPPSLLDIACVRLGTRAWNTQARRALSSGGGMSRRKMHDYAPSSASASGSGSSDQHAPALDQRGSYPAGGTNGPRNYKRSTLGALSVRPQPSTPKQVSLENEHTHLHMQEHTDIMDELQQRIDKLQKLDLKEDADSLDAHINADTAAFSEDELMNFYQDVLALPEENAPAVSAPDAVSEHENDMELVKGLHQRLLGSVSSSEAVPEDTITKMEVAPKPAPNQHTTILTHIRETLSIDSQDQEPGSLDSVESLDISSSEWESLTRIAASSQDGPGAVEALQLMIDACHEPPEPLLNSCMNIFARTGDIAATESFMSRFLPNSPTDTQRDMHIKSHLRSVPRGTTPHSALALLHSYEARALPAPIKTYSRAIGALLAVRIDNIAHPPASSSPAVESPRQAHAQAWDLYAHMRYAAHPTPDLMMYTLMLKACALPASGRSSVFSPLGTSEPERALDIWHEMTVEQGLAPNMPAYEAVISACARSGEERYVDEAFRLARQCLDGERDAHGKARFSATPSLCRALLDGAKRVGALGRARWILAEMIRVARAARVEEAEAQEGEMGGEGKKRVVVVDEQTMMHVFHAYSSYVPPFKRTLAKIVDGEDGPVLQSAEGELDPQDLVKEALSPESSTEDQVSEFSEGSGTESVTTTLGQYTSQAQASKEINLIHGPQFQTHVPQSHAEVLAEASFLFARILAAQGSPTPAALEPGTNTEDALAISDFSDVRLSPRLMNAFLSVFYAHGSTEACRVLWRDIWAQVASLGPQATAPVPSSDTSSSSASSTSSSSDASTKPGHTARVFLPLAPIARSYVEALERCSNAERGHERQVAFAWAQEIWPAWVREEAAWRAGRPTLPGLDYRMIEKAHAAMIRMLAVNGQMDKALTHLRGFVAAYPPRAVRQTPPKDEMRSTRTLLIGPNPLVRLTSAVHVADDRVPPIMTFGDLEIVHHRLQAANDAKGVGYVHWVCKAYEGELRRRREKMLLNDGKKGKGAVVPVS